MAQETLLGVSHLLLSLLQAGVYGLLIYWSFRFFEDLHLERFFPKLRFYHLFLPALALAGLAIGPANFVLGLLVSLLTIFSESWLFSFFSFVEGLALLWVINHLCQGFRSPGSTAGAKE